MTEEIRQFLKEQESLGFYLCDISKIASELAELEFRDKYENNSDYRWVDLYELENPEIDTSWVLQENFQDIFNKMHDFWENSLILDYTQNFEND